MLEYRLENLPFLFFTLLFVNTVQYKNYSLQVSSCKCVQLLIVWLSSSFHIINPSIPVALNHYLVLVSIPINGNFDSLIIPEDNLFLVSKFPLVVLCRHTAILLQWNVYIFHASPDYYKPWITQRFYCKKRLSSSTNCSSQEFCVVSNRKNYSLNGKYGEVTSLLGSGGKHHFAVSGRV